MHTPRKSCHSNPALAKFMLFVFCLFMYCHIGFASELASSFDLGQLNWKSLPSVETVFGSWPDKSPRPTTIINETFKSALQLNDDGTYEVILSKLEPTDDSFLDNFMGQAKALWGTPAAENNIGGSRGNRFTTDYSAEWTMSNTLIQFRFREINKPFIKDVACYLVFGSINRPAEASYPSSSEQFKAVIPRLSAYINSNPTDIEAYKYRAKLYFDQNDYDHSWEDVHAVERLGGEVNPAFLEELKIISYRPKAENER